MKPLEKLRTYTYIIPILLIVILWGSCRKELAYAPSAGNLAFSKDTVFLDTIFTNIGSTTHTLKIYNRNRDDVEIPLIKLAQGQNSKFRLNVDGVAGKEFQNIPIFAQDSIFVFIETTFDVSSTAQLEFLYTDAIQFDTGDNLQEVQLVTLVKDAIFLYPKTLSNGSKESLFLGLDNNGDEILVEGFSLDNDELTFTNEKPYVIYGYAAVPNNKQLIINAGAHVHFHKDSGILVQEGGSLQINGMLSTDQELLENEVVFEGDRLKAEFSTIPGQWGAIWLAAGSTNNTIDHLTIKNATVGLLVEGDDQLQSPTLTLKNTQIYNSASINLWGKTAFINAENIVLGGAGTTSLYCNLGGEYSFVHSTIANYWVNGFRAGTALQIDNFTITSSGDRHTADLTKADFTNCVIDGNNFLELALRNDENTAFEYSFTNCMLKFRDDQGQFAEDPLYNFENTEHYTEIFLNQSADFVEAIENDFKIENESTAKGNADINTALLVPLDILGVDRTQTPAIGAYQIEPDN